MYRILTTVIVIVGLFPVPAFTLAESPHDVVAKHGVVVSVEANASEVGLEVLRRGGNAVDAAVAVAFALAVTHPAAGNIGGGGFMMVHWAKTRETVCVEYREMAPAAATREIVAKLTETSRGHLSVGVPGTVRGLALAHERFGTRPWRELVEPAVRLAEEGFVVDLHLARSLGGWLKQAKDFQEVQRVFRKPDGSDWQPGDRLVQTDLAATLRLLAESGPDAFYSGPIADKIVADMQAGGGLITKEDLAAYRANELKPIHGTYRGHDIFGPPPPSSGGTALVEMLNILENFDLAQQGRDSAATVHQMAESMRRAYFDRAMHLGDPAFTRVPVERLTSKSYAKELADGIAARRDRATRSEDLGNDVLRPPPHPNPLPQRGEGELPLHPGGEGALIPPSPPRGKGALFHPSPPGGEGALFHPSPPGGEGLGVRGEVTPKWDRNTTHFSVVDKDGNAVANTYTLQDGYGSYVVVRGAGFLLNNEMTDFNLQPGVTDRKGRIGTDANLVAPHKRMLSSQTPTIVLKDGKVLLVTGSPGGRTIINTVLSVVTNVVDFQMPIRDAVDAPRMHHQWMPDLLRVERERLTDQTRQTLEAMGHKIESAGRQGDAHSIWVDPATGLRHGAADKGISGQAAGH